MDHSPEETNSDLTREIMDRMYAAYLAFRQLAVAIGPPRAIHEDSIPEAEELRRTAGELVLSGMVEIGRDIELPLTPELLAQAHAFGEARSRRLLALAVGGALTEKIRSELMAKLRGCTLTAISTDGSGFRVGITSMFNTPVYVRGEIVSVEPQVGAIIISDQDERIDIRLFDQTHDTTNPRAQILITPPISNEP